VSKQNSMRYPLNELFGTEAHVRLLRVLAIEADGPLTASDAAQRTGLTIPGAQKALRRLCKSGFVLRVGGGRKYQYEINRSDILVQMVLNLFYEEKNRYEELLNALKEKIESLRPHPHAVWIQAFPKELGEPLELSILHDTLHLANSMRDLRKQLNQIEQEFDLTIEISGNTKADIPFLDIKDITPLYGVLPIQFDLGRPVLSGPRKHEDREKWLIKLSQKIAEAVEHDASLIRRAKEHVDRLLQTDLGLATGDIIEWRDILRSYSRPRLIQFLTSHSERANRLRQSNPFFAVLSSDEKERLINGLEVSSDT
jgi:predicted transcriptional regulator